MEWQPIETAPKEGRPILLCDLGYIFIGYWMNNDKYRGWSDDTNNILVYPKHWMPLPMPPVRD